jgi:hypothetical protein
LLCDNCHKLKVFNIGTKTTVKGLREIFINHWDYYLMG